MYVFEEANWASRSENSCQAFFSVETYLRYQCLFYAMNTSVEFDVLSSRQFHVECIKLWAVSEKAETVRRTWGHTKINMVSENTEV